MKKIKIVLDVDGVLLNFMQTVSDYIEANYNLKSNIKYATTQYSLFDRFDEKVINKIDFDKIKEAFEKQGFWKSLQPMPNSEAMKEITHNPLFDIYFVTSIPTHLHDHRLQNLNTLLKTQIDKEHLICVPLGESKKPYIEQIKPDFFVEDSFKNLVECHGTHTSIWIDLNENYYDLSKKEDYNFITVHNFNDAIKIIKAHTYDLFSHDELIIQIQNSLSDDLLTPMYAKLKRQSKTEGHCYAAAEAMFHMLGGAHTGLTACVASFQENGQKLTHWWLKNKDGKIIDPTAEQFLAIGQQPPYELGHGAGFLTKAPSKRAREIINRVLDKTLDKNLMIEDNLSVKNKKIKM